MLKKQLTYFLLILGFNSVILVVLQKVFLNDLSSWRVTVVLPAVFSLLQSPLLFLQFYTRKIVSLAYIVVFFLMLTPFLFHLSPGGGFWNGLGNFLVFLFLATHCFNTVLSSFSFYILQKKSYI